MGLRRRTPARNHHLELSGRSARRRLDGRGHGIGPALSVTQVRAMLRRGGRPTLVFGNETSGLSRDHLDRCDLVLRITTDPGFPVLNLAQAIAISVALVAEELSAPPETTLPEPADHASVEALMAHMEEALLAVGFLAPVTPRRILRKLRRLLGRAGATHNEVAILHGICRQTLWAAGRKEADEDPRQKWEESEETAQAGQHARPHGRA